MIPARAALERLREGNRRFATGVSSGFSPESPERRFELTGDQAPFAAVLGCSDSRVPVEMIFDQGLGALFVTRVAGNVVGPTQLGSIEFALERLGTRLVVVLGHSRCGAVGAAFEALGGSKESTSPNLASIVDRVAPSVEEVVGTRTALDQDALVEHAGRTNVRSAVRALRRSEIVERRIHEEGVLVVGAFYALENGVVDFFDIPSPATSGSRR